MRGAETRSGGSSCGKCGPPCRCCSAGASGTQTPMYAFQQKTTGAQVVREVAVCLDCVVGVSVFMYACVRVCVHTWSSCARACVRACLRAVDYECCIVCLEGRRLMLWHHSKFLRHTSNREDLDPCAHETHARANFITPTSSSACGASLAYQSSTAVKLQHSVSRAGTAV